MTGDQPGREVSKEFREQIVRPLTRRHGWRYFKTNRNGHGHPRLVAPDGRKYVIPGSPSDYRSVRNCKAQLRRMFGVPL